MNAHDIVQKIGAGIQEALQTCQLFLGAEQIEFENAKIHPEYVTTIKVAEQLTGPDVVVCLESLMKTLRCDAIKYANMMNLNDKNKRNNYYKKAIKYKFGKNDKKRLDILVKNSDSPTVPRLFAEVKLFYTNKKGILNDIDRIFHLLDMYRATGIIGNISIYGAVSFHILKEGANAQVLLRKTSKLMESINGHLLSIKKNNQWLKCLARKELSDFRAL
ncbi:MAG: hypothetical protein HZC25_01130 [Rhodospirillales bacterium]|nr:hypothetical protein [Rhodospirillales bacterium]